MGLTDAERSVCSAIEAQRDELVALASALVGFDTTARDPGDPPRQEAALQEYLARRLSSAGAEHRLVRARRRRDARASRWCRPGSTSPGARS